MSGQTPNTSGIYTNPTAGVVTLGLMRAQAKARADMQRSNFVNPGEANQNLVESMEELYGLLVRCFREKYFFKTYAFTTASNQELYPTPVDFFKDFGLDWLQSPGTPNQNITLDNFEFPQRKQFTNAFMPSIFGLTAPQWMITHMSPAQIVIKPVPTGGMNLLLYYAPRFTRPYDSVVINLQGVIASIPDPQSVTLSTALGATPTVYTCVASGATGTQFNVGLTDGQTAYNLAAVLNQNFPLASNCFAVASGTQVTIQPLDTYQPWNIYYLTVNPLSMYTSPAIATNPAINTEAVLSNVVDMVNGWEEYVTIDYAIKALQKQEKDVSVLFAQKQAIIARMNIEAKPRTLGQAPRQGGRRNRNLSGWGGGW